MRPVALEVEGSDGAARAGTATTARGSFPTPTFMPVGTRAAVKLLDAADLRALRPWFVLANTYHLMLRPGVEVISKLGGLHRFMGWDGLLLTDSGGYQVFSLSASVDDEGVDFRSTYDGSRHRLTPEAAVDLQEALGADIQMALDVCCALPAGDAEVRVAAQRTLDWGLRAKAAHRREDQSLFGIVQGGVSPRLRREYAARTVDLGFDGYAVGGLSVGEPPEEMLPALGAAVEVLPARPPPVPHGGGGSARCWTRWLLVSICSIAFCRPGSPATAPR